MRRRTMALASVVLLGVLAALLAVGPRPDMEVTLRPVDLPESLDAFVAESESRYPDITPGTAKTIVWADSGARAPTRHSIVYLHGYSGSRQETHPLTHNLARELGANAFLTRLTGHGRGSEAFAEARLNDWLNDAAEALAIAGRLGERVILIGTSTGATLAAWAAAHPELGADLDALVLISPNFRPADPSAAILTWPWGGHLAELVIGPYREWQPYNELHRRYWTTRYPTRALLPMAALVALVGHADLASVAAPTLVLYSSSDAVVSTSEIVTTAATIGSNGATLVDVGDVGDPDDHVLAGDILSPEDTERIEVLIREFLATIP